MTLETVERIELGRLENPSADIVGVIAALSASAAVLGKALHPMTAANLAGVVRMMNTDYSSLIEGHNTGPRDIERALASCCAVSSSVAKPCVLPVFQNERPAVYWANF